MAFKLVRTDSIESCKIQLPVGVHMIGRGKFLDCDDKRVSRNHGKLEVSKGFVTIKSLHQNPCFIIKKGSKDTQIISKDLSAELSHGDRFGLLPDCFWFELLHSSVSDIDADTQQIPHKMEEPMPETEQFPETEQLPEIEQLPETKMLLETELSNKSDEEMITDNNDSQPINFEMQESFGDDGPESPSLIPPHESPTNNVPVKEEPESPVATRSKERQPEEIPTKRSHGVDDHSQDEVKKVKTEPVVKEEPDDTPGPSNDQGSSSKDDRSKNPPAPAKSPTQPRERCMYGASCYRRNPQHKTQFSHPTDPDWGSGPRGQCPYGSKCVRRDPRHWRDHEHPPGVQPPGNRPGRRKRQRQGSSSSEEASALIVEGKRNRKPIKRQSYSGSDSDERDPFGSDESDEWMPPKDKSQDESQDFTQGW